MSHKPRFRRSVAIIGYGYVGKAMEKFFCKHHDIKVYDPPYIEKNNLEGVVEKHEGENITFTNDKSDINACDLAVVCVPTPSNEDGSVDLSYIYNTFKWLNTPDILIKSTVPPGTTKKLIEGFESDIIDRRIAFSPEYIGEGKYVVQWWKDKGYPHPTDMKYHDFQIFGGERKVTSEIMEFFKPILGPEVKYIQTDSTTAELTKYMENSWGASKVTFCNEFANIAETLGVDYNELRELFLLDGRVERMHTAVFKYKRGFGGKCFPKDVQGVVKFSEEAGYVPEFLKEVLRSNDKFIKDNNK